MNSSTLGMALLAGLASGCGRAPDDGAQSTSNAITGGDAAVEVATNLALGDRIVDRDEASASRERFATTPCAAAAKAGGWRVTAYTSGAVYRISDSPASRIVCVDIARPQVTSIGGAALHAAWMFEFGPLRSVTTQPSPGRRTLTFQGGALTLGGTDCSGAAIVECAHIDVKERDECVSEAQSACQRNVGAALRSGLASPRDLSELASIDDFLLDVDGDIVPGAGKEMARWLVFVSYKHELGKITSIPFFGASGMQINVHFERGWTYIDGARKYYYGERTFPDGHTAPLPSPNGGL